MSELDAHHARLNGVRASGTQSHAWETEHSALTTALRDCAIAAPAATDWGIVFEFELPMEGGRRPDAVVFVGRALAVLEFKEAARPAQSFIDQVDAYARDLGEYHAESHGRVITPIVVLTRAVSESTARQDDDVITTDPAGLAHYLFGAYQPGLIDLDAWLHAPYAPLPTLVAAARRIFQHEPLPHVRRALSAGIPEAVELLSELVRRTEERGGHMLAFVSGVPGSGKTLVGLRLVYERAGEHATATFLSGNGPLVAVLRDALKSRVFVNDLHAFIKTYGLSDSKVPQQHVLVFDEAQRAWDRDYMLEKRGVAHSEAELLIKVGERLPRWAALVGLVGDGQEIYSGEEAGIGQWRDAALPAKAGEVWRVYCPSRIASEFAGLPVETDDKLDLTVSLRSKRADQLHRWVAHLLEGSLALAARLAAHLQPVFPIYLTRDIDAARTYATDRFAEEPTRRYGLVASSHDKILRKLHPPIDNGYQATTRLMNYGRWYNGDLDDLRSSLHLDQPVTEFGCQGLELDLPVVCWGDDYRWDGRAWIKRPIRRRYPQDDPEQLLTNSYRVLLTRGREGMLVFVPPVEQLDLTEHALLAAGVRPLPEELEAIGALAAGHGG